MNFIQHLFLKFIFKVSYLLSFNFLQNVALVIDFLQLPIGLSHNTKQSMFYSLLRMLYIGK